MSLKNIDTNLSIGFQRSATKFPHRLALDVNEEQYTYEQLSCMASTLTKVIIGEVSGENALVGLFAYRSCVAYAGILGILGAGGGYVPLHPDLPEERNVKVIDSSMINLMIVSFECENAFKQILPHLDQGMIFIMVCIEGVDEYIQHYPKHRFILVKDLSKECEDKLNIVPVKKNDIAYLLFTSGSTGEPKGVPVSHSNVRSYVKFLTTRFALNENDRCSQMHDLTFDFSVHDIYPTWEVGACLCVATKQDKLFPVSYIQKKRLTSWASVPSIGVIIDKYGRLLPGAFPELRYSFFCGEALYESIAQKWQEAALNSKIINLYGPTEATMAIAYYDWDSEKLSREKMGDIVPLGKIFDGQKARIIRENREIVAIDEPGELCLSGSQVTKGYWNNQEKSVSQYITFSDSGDVLWYRTGDLVREDAEHCIYYLGRIDNQVQILGNRVELGEVDKVLREVSGSEQAVAIPWPVSGGNASGLIAFVSAGKQLGEKDILDYCRDKLPKYMVPTNVRFIDSMPLNINGKIDRIQLKRLLEK